MGSFAAFLKRKVYRYKKNKYRRSTAADRDVKVVQNDFYYLNGRYLDLDNPVNFAEKIQWLKLNWKNPLLTQLADKNLVRKFVEEKVGAHILNEQYGAFKSFDEMDLNSLPTKFVLKCNHGAGLNLIVRDKNKVDWPKQKKKFDRWLTKNYYNMGMEWAYKNIEPRIVCEKFLKDDNHYTLPDYKIFCFGGKPEFIQVDIDREVGHKRVYFSTDWKKLEFMADRVKRYDGEVAKPDSLGEMLKYAAILSKDLPFVRTDFFTVNNKVYFGEMTFYPENGTKDFTPVLYNKKFGDLINLPERLEENE